MFFTDSLRNLKKELKTAGGDISFVKEWQKGYDKVKKQGAVLQSQYTKTKSELERVLEFLQVMEGVLIAQNAAMNLAELKNKLSKYKKDLRKYQNNFDCEFLIGKEDKEFHLIYETILSLCEKGIGNQGELLILQSEVENLMAITKEALEKEWPDFRELAYFYLGHTDAEIFELPHADKLQMVQRLYIDEFYNPMKQVVETALGTERARQIMEVDLWI